MNLKVVDWTLEARGPQTVEPEGVIFVWRCRDQHNDLSAKTLRMVDDDGTKTFGNLAKILREVCRGDPCADQRVFSPHPKAVAKELGTKADVSGNLAWIYSYFVLAVRSLSLGGFLFR